MTTDPFEAAYGEAEGTGFVEAFGNRYEVARKVPAMPMMKFAKLAAQGMDSTDMAAGAAIYDLLRGLFTREAWARFEDDATESGADSDELLAVVKDAIEVINGFPTTPSSASSDGPSTTTPNSTGPSFAERKAALGLVPVTPDSIAELVSAS